MERFDVIVVGGGPGGSSCAARLVRAGCRVLLLDRAEYPRLKLCAGWITPEVVSDLGLEPAHYPHRFNTFEKIIAHVKGLTIPLATPQHSIRRVEFDDYLLRHCGADIRQHNVRTISASSQGYVVDDLYQADYLVGAGGTRCPVYRALFRELNPRAKELQAATWEHEIPYQWTEERCHLWFFDNGLPGYSWYVPKADGYLNLGIGAMAEKLKARGDDIKTQWKHFIEVLVRRGLIAHDTELNPKGYSYYLRDAVECIRNGNAFIVGDAIGLATRDMCEGIGPAIRSGHQCADAIAHGADYSLDHISAYSIDNRLIQTLLGYQFVGRRSAPRTVMTPPAASSA